MMEGREQERKEMKRMSEGKADPNKRNGMSEGAQAWDPIMPPGNKSFSMLDQEARAKLGKIL